jgi:hypothetical protein
MKLSIFVDLLLTIVVVTFVPWLIPVAIVGAVLLFGVLALFSIDQKLEKNIDENK